MFNDMDTDDLSTNVQPTLFSLPDAKPLLGAGLTSFVSKELGYNVIHTSRKNKYTFTRFVLANHLRHTMNMAWIPMGHVFNSKHHSSMMNCVSTYKCLVSTGDIEFCIIKDMVESLIKQYDAKQNK